MRYRGTNEKKHYLLKAVLAVLVAFLIYVACADTTPNTTRIEKVVPNAVNQ